jgi:hypothetical protein
LKTLIKTLINYEFVTSDHLPIAVTCNIDNIHLESVADEDPKSSVVSWSDLGSDQIAAYNNTTDNFPGHIALDRDLINCFDTNCKNVQHEVDIDALHDQISDCLHTASDILTRTTRARFRQIPGWIDYCKEAHST